MSACEGYLVRAVEILDAGEGLGVELFERVWDLWTGVVSRVCLRLFDIAPEAGGVLRPELENHLRRVGVVSQAISGSGFSVPFGVFESFECAQYAVNQIVFGADLVAVFGMFRSVVFGFIKYLGQVFGSAVDYLVSFLYDVSLDAAILAHRVECEIPAGF